MASFSIHLAVGVRYLEKNPSKIKYRQKFLDGVVVPDFASDKKESHYTTCFNKENLPQHLDGKVSLYNFLKDNALSTDFDMGIFMHLITDYLFFNEFFEKDMLLHISYDEFVADLYYSYDVVRDYVEKKYNILYSNYSDIVKRIKEKSKTIGYENSKNIISIDKLDKFIERVSDINLEEYKVKIFNAGKNILP